MYNPDSEDEQRRAYALDQAVRLASEQQTGNYDGQIVVNIASAFDKFLKDGDAG